MALQPTPDINAAFIALGKGSEKALMQIHARYFPGLMNYCFDIVADKELAKEIALDAFQALWENRKPVSEMDNPVGWLFKCGAYKALNELKAKKRSRTIAIGEHATQTSPGNAEKDIDAKELSRLIGSALNRLPAMQKKIIELNRAGWTRREIASHCCISENTVKNHITEAFKNLRKILKEIPKDFFS